MEPLNISCPLGEVTQTLLPFKNPLNHPINVHCKLIDKSKVENQGNIHFMFYIIYLFVINTLDFCTYVFKNLNCSIYFCYIPLHMTSDTNPYSRRVVRVAGKGRHHNDSS